MEFWLYILLLQNTVHSQNTTNTTSILPIVSSAINTEIDRTYFPLVLYIIIVTTILLSIVANIVYWCKTNNKSKQIANKKERNQLDCDNKNKQVSINYLLANKIDNLFEYNDYSVTEINENNDDYKEEVVNNLQYDAAINMIMSVVECDKADATNSSESENKNKQIGIDYLLGDIQDKILNLNVANSEEYKDEQKVNNNLKYDAAMNMIMGVIESDQEFAKVVSKNKNEHVTIDYLLENKDENDGVHEKQIYSEMNVNNEINKILDYSMKNKDDSLENDEYVLNELKKDDVMDDSNGTVEYKFLLQPM